MSADKISTLTYLFFEPFFDIQPAINLSFCEIDQQNGWYVYILSLIHIYLTAEDMEKLKLASSPECTSPDDSAYEQREAKIMHGPVSYTHLDVYKRQVHIPAPGHPVKLPGGLHGEAVGRLTLLHKLLDGLPAVGRLVGLLLDLPPSRPQRPGQRPRRQLPRLDGQGYRPPGNIFIYNTKHLLFAAGPLLDTVSRSPTCPPGPPWARAVRRAGEPGPSFPGRRPSAPGWAVWA